MSFARSDPVKAETVPAYMVFTNAQPAEMVKSRPTTRVAFGSMLGFGLGEARNRVPDGGRSEGGIEGADAGYPANVFAR